MSFAKFSAGALVGLLLCSTAAFAGGVGGGTELPNNAEPNRAKSGSEKQMDKGSSVEQGGSMEKGGMEKGGDMKKGGDKM